VTLATVIGLLALVAVSVGAVLGAFCVADAVRGAIDLWEERKWEPRDERTRMVRAR
jgi:hypothetical protein